MSLHVEAATEGDIPAWLELAAEVGDLFGVDMAGDPEFHRTLKCNIARGTAFCVRVDNELAGAMLFRRGWINWLAVRKRFRHRGAGRASSPSRSGRCTRTIQCNGLRAHA